MRKIKAKIKLEGRVETGALQINDDWPGLFVRGDDCAMLYTLLLDYLKVAGTDTCYMFLIPELLDGIFQTRIISPKIARILSEEE